jgi:mannose-6-phosphate isomerase-like protein (cupin superfamily)
MKGYIKNIEQETLENENFRKVLYTDPLLQLVVMSLLPGEEIGEEVHELDQFIRVESGEGEAVLDGERQDIGDGSAIVIPKGTLHNIVNTSSDEPLKLYTIYTPPDHRPDTIHETKADAQADTDDHYE